MGHTVVSGEFHSLGIDHDKAKGLRRVIEQQAGDDGVDADRFSRSGGPCDQKVGHGGQIGGYSVAGNILAERKSQRGA